MKVGIKYCGNCSPRADLSRITEQLREDMRQRTQEVVFTYYSRDTDVDAVLILNACGAACAGKPSFEGPVIVATPDSVDWWTMPPEELVPAIRERILALPRA